MCIITEIDEVIFMEKYSISGMTCASCQAHVEKAVEKVNGVCEVNVSLLTNSMTVEGSASSQEIIEAVEKAGYGASLEGAKEEKKEDISQTEIEDGKKRLLYSSIVLILLMYITMGHNMLGWPIPSFLHHNYVGLGLLQLILTTIVCLLNKKFFITGLKSLFHGSPNMDSLIALGSGVSYVWSLYILFKMTYEVSHGNLDLMMMYHHELYFESSAMILVFVTIGKTLEAISKGKTTNALNSLLDLSVKKATIERDGKQISIPIEEVKVGDVFLVKPGESIPTDGVILEGNTAIDESMLTGESIPEDKGINDEISGGTLNTSGFIKAKATRVGQDTTLSKIIARVMDASSSKAPIARIADQISYIFVPTVMGIAFLVFMIWLFLSHDVAQSLARGISVLVVACPCALGLATPSAIMVGNGLAAKHGILFKNAEALENTGKIEYAILDKTGTITQGRPVVTDIIPSTNITKEELLQVAIDLEVKSEHPLAKAITTYGQEKGMKPQEVTDFEAIVGHGLQAKQQNVILYGGSYTSIRNKQEIPSTLQQQSDTLANQGKTPLFFMKDNEILGVIAVADTIRPEAKKAIQQLHNQGIKTVMLTGDQEKTAHVIAKQAGVDEVIAEVLPSQKEEVVKKYQKSGKVMMVGDGINDAIALTSADIGVAIGNGTDVAIDSADIVLMKSRLTDVANAILLSKAVIKNIKENLFWAFAYNMILIPLAAGVISSIQMNPMWAAAAMSLSSVTVCLNALRLNLFQIKEEVDIHKEEKKEEEEKMEKVVKIEGMMCKMCAKHTKEALEKVAGIESADVSNETGTAKITCSSDVSEEVVKKAVEEAGYTFVSMQ